MLAREYCDMTKPKIKFKPVILSHHMLAGLKEGQTKMSKSDPGGYSRRRKHHRCAPLCFCVVVAVVVRVGGAGAGNDDGAGVSGGCVWEIFGRAVGNGSGENLGNPHVLLCSRRVVELSA